jgi:hypothetical protein
MNLEDDDLGDSDDEDSDEDSVEETPLTHTNLIVCELYYGAMHGSKENDGTFLTYSVYPGDQCGIKRALKDARMIRRENRDYHCALDHSTIRNYSVLLKSGAFVAPQIAKCMYLPSGELVAVLKTCYLKIFQRIWKRYYKQKMEELETRKSIHAILNMRLHRK